MRNDIDDDDNNYLKFKWTKDIFVTILLKPEGMGSSLIPNKYEGSVVKNYYTSSSANIGVGFSSYPLGSIYYMAFNNKS
jgi:glycine cleavage system protein P-like pyridoxal-binding family